MGEPGIDPHRMDALHAVAARYGVPLVSLRKAVGMGMLGEMGIPRRHIAEAGRLARLNVGRRLGQLAARSFGRVATATLRASAVTTSAPTPASSLLTPPIHAGSTSAMSADVPGISDPPI